MKILFVHNKYGKRSGEEIMIDRIMDLLRARGHEIHSYFADSAEIQSTGQKLSAAVSGIYSPHARRALRAKLAEIQPDLVQIQNLYPLISPAVLPVIAQAGVPIVMRLSNYRLICPTGLFLSGGEVCTRCSGGHEWNCVRRNCEGSLFKSTAYALRGWSARVAGHYTRNVTRYYAQTAFQRQILVDNGFDPARIDVIPNMIDVPEATAPTSAGRYVGFVGRLSTEKGVDTLLQAAAAQPQIPFRFAGDPGAYAGRALPANVDFLGALGPEDLAAFYREAAMIVVPSLWYEGFPGVIIEAMRHARPVIASDIGGLPEIVQAGSTGQVVPAGDAAALGAAIAALWADPARRQGWGAAGFAHVRKTYSSAQYYDRLMQTYAEALGQPVASLSPQAQGSQTVRSPHDAV